MLSPAGLVGLLGSVGSVWYYFAPDPTSEPPAVSTVLVLLGGSVLALVLCVFAVIAAVRRLNPRTTHPGDEGRRA